MQRGPAFWHRNELAPANELAEELCANANLLACMTQPFLNLPPGPLPMREGEGGADDQG